MRINDINKIKFTFCFNILGQLINFASDNRNATVDMKQYRFSTPVKEYAQTNGINIWIYGDGVWHYPDKEFVN